MQLRNATFIVLAVLLGACVRLGNTDDGSESSSSSGSSSGPDVAVEDTGVAQDESSSSTGEACNAGAYADTGSVDELPTDCVFEFRGDSYPCETTPDMFCGPYGVITEENFGDVEECRHVQLIAAIDACIAAAGICEDWIADETPTLRCHVNVSCRDCVKQFVHRYI